MDWKLVEMGMQFKPSEGVKSDVDPSSGDNNKDVDSLKEYKLSAPETPPPPYELKFNNTQYVNMETITLPSAPGAKTGGGETKGSFCQHFIGMIPGLLTLFACGMQLCWGTIQYDLAIWKQMNEMPFCFNILAVVCWYIGAIIGSPIGGYLTLKLGKKYIYMITALLLLLSGESLQYADSKLHHITGRMLLGVTFSIAQLSTIAYASEVPIIRLRSFLIFIVGYINAVSVLFATLIASIIPVFTNYYGSNHVPETEIKKDINHSEDQINNIIAMSGTIIMIIGVLVLVLAPLISRESVRFLVTKRNFDQAFVEYEKSYATDGDNSLAVRNDFENRKLYILSDPTARMNIFKKDNFVVLRRICASRLLSMLFSSIYMSAIMVRMINLRVVQNTTAVVNVDGSDNQTTVVDSYDQTYDLNLLLGCKSFQLGLGLLLLIVSFKCNIERFCYKLSFVCGIGIVMLYVVFRVWSELISLPAVLMTFSAVVLFIDIMICLTLRVHIDMYHYLKIDEAFDDNNNHYKIWSLVFVNCVEHVVHILLLVQIFWFVAYPLLFSGFGIAFISFWLLKQMHNAEMVQPWENQSRLASAVNSNNTHT